MKRTLTLNLFLFFVLWGTFKSAESLLRVGGAQEVYAFYGVEWLYFAMAIFGVIGGLTLTHAIWKAKSWGYILGLAWLIVAVANSIFTGAVAYFNKPLMTQILTTIGESRGRGVASVEAFVNSPMYTISIVGASVVMTAIVLFFIWHLYQRREYFKPAQQASLN